MTTRRLSSVADSDWTRDGVHNDPFLSAANQAGNGCIEDFVATTSSRAGSRLSLYRRLKGCVPAWIADGGRDVATKLYIEKCKELYSGCPGSNEKVSDAFPPLGSVLLSPNDDRRNVYAEAVEPDPDPLIQPQTEESRIREVQRLQARQKAIDKHRVRDDYRVSDERDDVLTEAVVRDQIETPDRLSHELGPTRDCLEFATRKYWKLRRYLSHQGVVFVRFRLLVCAVVQFVAAVALFCLGALHLDGGDFRIAVTATMTACVAVGSAFLLVFTTLPQTPDDRLTFFVYCAEIWLVFLLTSFVLADVVHIRTLERECDPSVQTYTAADSCSNRPEEYALLCLGTIMMVVAYVSTYSTIELLDRSNRRSSWADKFLLFRYRHTTLRELQMPLLNYGLWNKDARLVVVPKTEATHSTMPDVVEEDLPAPGWREEFEKDLARQRG